MNEEVSRAIRLLRSLNYTVEPPSNVNTRWGCHLELDDGMEPDSCVIDDGVRELCAHASRIECKEQCFYWKSYEST